MSPSILQCFRQFNVHEGSIRNRGGRQNGFDAVLQEEWRATKALFGVCVKLEESLAQVEIPIAAVVSFFR